MCPREGRAGSKEGEHWALCLASIYFLGFQKEQAFHSLSWIFPGLVPFLNLILYPLFPRLCPPPLWLSFWPLLRMHYAKGIPFFVLSISPLIQLNDDSYPEGGCKVVFPA